MSYALWLQRIVVIYLPTYLNLRGYKIMYRNKRKSYNFAFFYFYYAKKWSVVICTGTQFQNLISGSKSG